MDNSESKEVESAQFKHNSEIPRKQGLFAVGEPITNRLATKCLSIWQLFSNETILKSKTPMKLNIDL